MHSPIITSALCVLAFFPAHAQNAVKVPPPSLGPLVSYTYWPTQYVQWVGTELPYSMIELDVDGESKTRLLYVTLTERISGKRVHYTNSEGLVAAAKAQHEEAYKTEIAFESDDTESVGSTVSLRFTLADGKPLQWRFVQGSDISEQGSGLTPLPSVPVPIFVYREQGAVAGEGTALQVGDVVSTAEVWKEISHPPQFVAYRGAVTKDAHTVVFAAGKESWSVASAPAALAVGSGWELDSATGNHRTLRILKVEGAHVTLAGADRFQPSVHFTFEGSFLPGGWSVDQLRYAPVHGGDKHFASVVYTPALNPAVPSGEAGLSLAFGKRKPVAEGSMKMGGTVAEPVLTLSFSAPAWLHGKAMTETITATDTTLSTVAHP